MGPAPPHSLLPFIEQMFSILKLCCWKSRLLPTVEFFLNEILEFLGKFWNCNIENFLKEVCPQFSSHI